MIPSHALSIWSDADHLYAWIPSTNTHNVGHTVAFDNTPEGLARCFKLASDRAQLVGKLGEPTAPTKWQLGQEAKVLSKGKPVTRALSPDRFEPGLKAAARDVLRRVGIL
jgi:hypothetical protein